MNKIKEVIDGKNSLKKKKSDKDTYLVRNVKSAYGELEYDDSLLEEDQVVEPIEKRMKKYNNNN